MKFFLIVIIAVIIAGGALWYRNYQNSSMDSRSNTTSEIATNPNTVEIRNFAYSPKTMTIQAGTEVTFTNNDSVMHTVTADNASFDSGSIDPGQSYAHTFSDPGTINYHCTPHPYMTASIVVK